MGWWTESLYRLTWNYDSAASKEGTWLRNAVGLDWYFTGALPCTVLPSSWLQGSKPPQTTAGAGGRDPGPAAAAPTTAQPCALALHPTGTGSCPGTNWACCRLQDLLDSRPAFSISGACIAACHGGIPPRWKITVLSTVQGLRWGLYYVSSRL